MPGKIPLVTRFTVYGIMRPIGAVLSAMHGLGHQRGLNPGDDRVRVLRGLRYGQRSRAQAIDVYLPRHVPRGARLPTVFFVHGGAWVMCNRAVSASMGRSLAALGYAVVAPGYRLLPDCKPEEQQHDVQNALQKTLELAQKDLPLDPDSMIIMGESAGAHLTARLLQSYPDEAPKPKGWIGIFGVYDLQSMGRSSRRGYIPLVDSLVQGQDREAVLKRHDAMRALPWDDLPVLLIHGENDAVVSVEQSKAMAQLLEAQGLPVKLVLYPGADHGFIYAQKPPGSKLARAAYLAILRFMQERGVSPRPRQAGSSAPPASLEEHEQG